MLKITIRCQNCGLTLKEYPVRGPTLPHRCPRCQAKDPFTDYRTKTIYIPDIKIGRLRR